MALSLEQKAQILVSEGFQTAMAELCDIDGAEELAATTGSLADLHRFFQERGIDIPADNPIGLEVSGDDMPESVARAAAIYQPGCIGWGKIGGCLCYKHCSEGGKKKNCWSLCL